MKNTMKFSALFLVLAVVLGAFSVFAAEAPTLSIEYTNLSFRSNVCVKYAVASDSSAKTTLLIWDAPQTEYTYGTHTAELESVGVQTIEEKEYMIFDYTALSAKQMTDVVYARAYTVVGDVEYYSGLAKYSILKYAYDMLGKTAQASEDENLKVMLEDMLAYGASAQKFFDYETDRLATDDFYQVTVAGGTLSDGANYGLYKAGETVNVVAAEADENDVPFFAWKNGAGVEVANTASATITVGSANETYIAVYEEVAEEITALSGQGTEEDPYLINNAAEMAFFRDSVNAGNNYEGKYVKLNDNVDLEFVNWTPIGDTTDTTYADNSSYKPTDDSKIFKGVFDGNDKAIFNLKIEKYFDGDPNTDAILGLFGLTGEGAYIKDLTITNVDIDTDGRNVGALAGVAYKSVYENITVNGDIQIFGGHNVSGVCAVSRYYDFSATNITVSGADGSAIVGKNIVGGIFAEIAPQGSTQIFDNLKVENVEIKGTSGVGGIVGLLTKGTISNVSVKDVELVGKTTWKENEDRIRLGSVVGLLGSNYATVSDAAIENVTAKNLEGEDVELPVVGANYSGDIGNATEARIGDKYYATFAKALAAANGEEITLLSDITITSKLNITSDTVINGNGKTLTYTGTDSRVVDVTKETNGADLTLKNLTINIDASYCQRGINYNTCGTLTLDNVAFAGTKATYAVNLPSSSNGATVEITNSDIIGHIALNVWGQNAVINVTDSNLSNYDPTEVENYTTIVLNNDGTTVAEGTVINVTGGTVTSLDQEGNPSTVTRNGTETGAINISETTTVIGDMGTTEAVVRYLDGEGNYYTDFYSCASLQRAIDKAAESTNSVVVLIKDIELTSSVTVDTGKTVVIDLNGHTVSGAATEEMTSLIVNKGTLTINGDGEIAISCDITSEKAINAISNSGVLTVNGGKISNTGAGMQIGYAIDNYNGATLTVNGGEITASGSGYYDGIRLFCGSNETLVTVNDGKVSSIWAQNPSANKATEVKGTVILNGGTLGTTYYENYTTVAVNDGVTATVTPYGAGSDKTTSVNEEGYTVYSFVHGVTTADELLAALAAGEDVVLAKDIDLTDVEFAPAGATVETAYSGTIDGKGHKIIGLSYNGTEDVAFGLIAYGTGDVTVKNIVFEDVNIQSAGEYAAAVMGLYVADQSENAATYNVNFENITVNGAINAKDKAAAILGCNYRSSYPAKNKNITFTFENCVNNADISGASRNGGIAGAVSGEFTADGNNSEIKVVFNNCTNSGTVASTSATYKTGAIVGFASGTMNYEFNNCTNTGTADGDLLGRVHTSMVSYAPAVSNEKTFEYLDFVPMALTTYDMGKNTRVVVTFRWNYAVQQNLYDTGNYYVGDALADDEWRITIDGKHYRLPFNVPVDSVYDEGVTEDTVHNMNPTNVAEHWTNDEYECVQNGEVGSNGYIYYEFHKETAGK